MDRPGHDGGRPPNGWSYELLEAPLLEVSAIDIRSKVGSGLPIDAQVPVGVADLIDQHGLYGAQR
jgi:nicotinic acid mononucleotide adenylyltransferase